MTNHQTPVLELTELRKRYGDRDVVSGLSLALQPGSVCALLGRNGAGKTTTIQIIMGLAFPTEGEVRILGEPSRSPAIHEVRRRVGYLPDDPLLYDHLSGREFLHFVGELHGVPRRELERLDSRFARLGLLADADTLLRACSLGTRRKIAFLAAILPDPEILVLDEPTSTLDAVSAREVRRIILEFRDRGRLVLFTTHVMDEAERLADRISILHEGTIRFDGGIAELRREHGRGQLEPLEEIFIRLTATRSEEPSASGPSPSGRSNRLGIVR